MVHPGRAVLQMSNSDTRSSAGSVEARSAEKALREIRRLCETIDPSRSESLIAMIKHVVDAALAPSDEYDAMLSTGVIPPSLQDRFGK